MRREWQIMALLATATIAVFWRVGRHEFVNYDDPAYVTHNPTVHAGLTWPGVKWPFGELHGEATYWHPITWLSHMLDCQLFGLRPAGHHLTNLVLYTLNTLLLFALLRRLTGDASRVTSGGLRVTRGEGSGGNLISRIQHPTSNIQCPACAGGDAFVSTRIGLVRVWADEQADAGPAAAGDAVAGLLAARAIP
jgi:hypothetical protein